MGKCSVDGCDKPSRSRGWCVAHWARWKRTGSTDGAGIIRGDDLARFWQKVDKRGPDDDWPWLGAIDRYGYGRFRWTNSDGRHTHIGAHVAAYLLLVGPIPEGLHVDHVYARGCRRTDCVNPAHLEPVTPGENIRRSEPARRKFCPQGHEYTPENTSHASGTGRTCVTCNRERNRRKRSTSRGVAASIDS